MSGPLPDSGEPDADILAAEYVLGLLDPAQMRAVARTLETDPALARSVDLWVARLEPLGSLVAPVPPSDMLWQRIAQDLPRAASAGAGDRGAAWRPNISAVAPRRLIWRALGIGGYALAAALAIVLMLSSHRLDVRIAWDAPKPAPSDVGRRPSKPLSLPAPALPAPAPGPNPAPPAVPSQVALRNAVALLTAAGSDRPAMKAFFRQGGTVKLVAVQTVSVPAGKELGFWVWPHGTALPIPLGRVDAAGGTLRFPYYEADGTPVMVTLEPRHVPVTDTQGPTLFTGQLIATN